MRQKLLVFFLFISFSLLLNAQERKIEFEEYKLDEKNLEYSEFDEPLGYLGSLFPLSNGILEAAGIDQRVMTSKVITAEGELIYEAINEFEDSIVHIKSIQRKINICYPIPLVHISATHR